MTMQFGRLVAVVLILAFGNLSWARGPEPDPASVSDGLKAIFKYGNTTRQTADRLNANTVTIMTGTIAGTYVQFGADLASALDNGDNLRVLPIVGRGSVQGVADILYLKGVDLGIVRSDTSSTSRKKDTLTISRSSSLTLRSSTTKKCTSLRPNRSIALRSWRARPWRLI